MIRKDTVKTFETENQEKEMQERRIQEREQGNG